MRDPEGRLLFHSIHVSRTLYQPLAPDHFLFTGASKSLVADNALIPYECVDHHTIQSPRIPFVTHPYEWTNGQFEDAALLTLNVSEAILKDGFELKDGSAWNIVFDGARPVFCDHLSFQRIVEPQWWAFAQFVRHFIFPLGLARYRGLDAKDSFKVSRDGVAPDQARKLLGARRYLTRLWPLLIDKKQAARV